jgi:hypothetical protein
METDKANRQEDRIEKAYKLITFMDTRQMAACSTLYKG